MKINKRLERIEERYLPSLVVHGKDKCDIAYLIRIAQAAWAYLQESDRAVLQRGREAVPPFGRKQLREAFEYKEDDDEG